MYNALHTGGAHSLKSMLRNFCGSAHSLKSLQWNFTSWSPHIDVSTMEFRKILQSYNSLQGLLYRAVN